MYMFLLSVVNHCYFDWKFSLPINPQPPFAFLVFPYREAPYTASLSGAF